MSPRASLVAGAAVVAVAVVGLVGYFVLAPGGGPDVFVVVVGGLLVLGGAASAVSGFVRERRRPPRRHTVVNNVIASGVVQGHVFQGGEMRDFVLESPDPAPPES